MEHKYHNVQDSARMCHIVRDSNDEHTLCGRVIPRVQLGDMLYYVTNPGFSSHRYVSVGVAITHNYDVCPECTLHEDYPLMVLSVI